MPEDSKEAKKAKLAAAKKKLKEFQKRGAPEDNAHVAEAVLPSTTGSVCSNLSEKSESELSLNGSNNGGFVMVSSGNVTPSNPIIEDIILTAVQTVEPHIPTVSSYFATAPEIPAVSVSVPTPLENNFLSHSQEHAQNLNALQVLINEKTQLNADLNKYRSDCREKEFELEELKAQLQNVQKRWDDLQQFCSSQEQTMQQLRNSNAELQHKMSQSRAENEDQTSHLSELQQQLSLQQTRANVAEEKQKEISNELEMAQLRIRQLSDENNITKDNRVETLMQNQFMHEQQIRDLQAMVQQMTQDKEQASAQYQNYVQHLNFEVSNLNEKNSELQEENCKLQEREKQLVDHISSMEKEIQRNIARQDQLKEKQNSQQAATSSSSDAEMQSLKEKLEETIQDFALERHEFQLKIKSQEDRLESLNLQLNAKQQEFQQLQDRLENLSSEQPDQSKLLATMESDKVAASRAMSQNVELKKQLDELELRFVQLTNDKADLMNKLDAEEFANREMRTSFAEMQQKLETSDDRFRYKDEEMIRLSHENMELLQKISKLQQHLQRYKQHEKSHSHKHDISGEHKHSHENCSEHEHDLEPQHKQEETGKEATENDLIVNENQQDFEKKDDNDHSHEHNDSHGHEHEHDHSHEHSHSHDHTDDFDSRSSSPLTPYIATEDAVEKLQERFTHLISQVADLTDEKQRLEHLVLQLQGETETIGEYITLYQTQRRILKQREYEKAAQMQLLQTEREHLREKITLLNNLVGSLGVEIPQNTQDHFKAVLNETATAVETTNHSSTNASNDNTTEFKQLNSNDSQQIINKIQNIISEIKENSLEVPTIQPLHTVDHLNCCLGKFEVV